MQDRFARALRAAARWRGLVFSLLLLALLLAVALFALSAFEGRADGQQEALLSTAVRGAAITCYAVEGRYPARISYLQEHYGVTWDEARFIVRYDAFADNVLPEIAVYRIGGGR